MKKSVLYEDRVVFERFYKDLVNKTNIFFLYCTTNLLHYILANIEFHQDRANFVLITGGLSNEEKKFVSEYIKTPVCHLEKSYIDFYIWDLLIETSDENFGWLDIDCFIHGRSIFEDISDISAKTSIQAVWVRKYAFYHYAGILTSTYLQYVNIDVAKKMWKKFPKLSMIPVVYSDDIGDVAFEEYRKISKDEVEYLKRIYPLVGENKVGLDTTHYYQMLAVSNGYQIKMVRGLTNNEFSKEIIHLGGAHRMVNYTLGVNKHRFFDRFNMRYSYYLLKSYSDILPKQYQNLLDCYEKNLERNKINQDFDDIIKKVQEYISLNAISLPILK